MEVGAEEPVPGDTHHMHRDKLEARWAGWARPGGLGVPGIETQPSVT